MQTRSFCYISDMIDGMIGLMNHEPVSGPVNLGNPEEFTIRELAETVIELTGSMSVIEERPMPPDDPSQRQPDIALARRLFGWTPGVSLREGLLPSIDYFERLLTSTRASGGRSAMRRRLRHQLPELAAMDGDNGMRITARRRQFGGEA